MERKSLARSSGSATLTLSPAPLDPILQSDLTNPLRKFCFRCLVVLVFVRFSMLHQLLTFQLGINIYLLYIFGIPCIVGCFVTGGFRRVFRFRAPFYWCGFAVCLIGASIFSSWVGGSVRLVGTYLRTDFLMVFLVGGIAVGWKECRTLIFTLSLAALVSEISFKVFAQLDSEGRTSLQFGMISNSNDYAAHLILVLPFLLWSALTTKSFLFRIISIVGVGFGGYQILASASRGGFIALMVSGVATLFMLSARQRAIGLIVVIFMGFAGIAMLPRQVLMRLVAFSENNPEAAQEALQSSGIRKQLLKDSINFAVSHPVFGLGPGRFSEIEGLLRKQEGGVGLYFEAHNSFMAVAAESGLPAFIFYISAIVSSYMLLTSVKRNAGTDPAANDVRNAVICMKVAFLGFCTAIFFLNFAYFFYLPALTGLITAMAASFPALTPVRAPSPSGFPPAASRFVAGLPNGRAKQQVRPELTRPDFGR